MPLPQRHFEESHSKERRHLTISEDQMDEIAEKAAEKAVAKLEDRMYREIGRGVLKKLSWMVGIAAVSLFIWAQKNGWLKL